VRIALAVRAHAAVNVPAFVCRHVMAGPGRVRGSSALDPALS